MTRSRSWIVLSLLTGALAGRGETLQFGTAKVDITPERPLRLSGYSNRDRPFEGIEQRIWCRTLAERDGAGTLTVWSSVELLGVTPAMRKEILARVEDLGVVSSRLALCATHTHAAPALEGNAPNLFAPRMTGAEFDHMREYTQWVSEQVADSIREAVTHLAPGTLELGWGEAGFAANRRVLQDGVWKGFGVQQDAPVDHRLPVLRVKDADGKVRAIVSNYACHATTLPGEYNRLCGDWPGYSSEYLEAEFPGAVALALIGCGADANPEPRGTLELAKAHGRSMANAVKQVLSRPMTPMGDAPAQATIGFASLPIDRPTIVELTARLASKDRHIKQHAQAMLAILDRKDRIPETYPAPIQIIRFGDELTMVFLGGEVVVDYTLRLRRELAEEIPADKLWVTAYANDVYGYLASERMRAEGGYEFDYSMYFYEQPGPWSSGTEDLVQRRIGQILHHPEGEGNLSPEDALRSIEVADGLTVELVAAEPMVADPVNLAFGPDGKLWVAEMGDYPLGDDNQGGAGGRVRYLEDVDGDGLFDRSVLFVDQLHYATGVQPWKDGVLISTPPEILYVEVDKKTGKAGRRQTILDGFGLGNPQHVVNGFSVGIDNWYYVNGDETGIIRSLATGKTVNMQGRDGRFKPASGELETECGMTQHLRSRDDWGRWIGGANYCPFWHYVLEERYLLRNLHVATPRPWQELYDGFHPQVFPISQPYHRFNDLFTTGRFTSACSPMPYRDDKLGPESREMIFACEPVHNLVHRARMTRAGLELHAERFPADAESEFFASRDPWCRPVRVLTGPDGAVWIADMYRLVIEHPTWIPESWLDRLDVRAGSDKGRIYRVFRPGEQKKGPLIPRLIDRSTEELVALLESPNGWTRDTAQQLLLSRQDSAAVPALVRLVERSKQPLARIHALGTLDGLGAVATEVVLRALDDPVADVRRWGVRYAEPFLDSDPRVLKKVIGLANDDEIEVRLQVACSLGESMSPDAAKALAQLARHDEANSWMRVAILSSSSQNAPSVLRQYLAEGAPGEGGAALVDGWLATAIGTAGPTGVAGVLDGLLPEAGMPTAAWQWGALASLIDSLGRRGSSLAQWRTSTGADAAPLLQRLQAMFTAARTVAQDPDAEVEDRVRVVPLLARGIDQQEADRQLLIDLIVPSVPIEVQAEAVHTTAKLADGAVARDLLLKWRSHGPAVRGAILSALLTRPEWIETLLGAIEKGSVATADIPASARQELVNLDRASLAKRAQQLFASETKGRQEVMVAYQGVLMSTGDRARGKDLFVKHCATCHRFGGIGQLVGPDLAGVRDRSPTYLLPSVLDPNRAVESKYLSYTVQLVDGRSLTGMLVVETGGSVTLARPDGKQARILRADIEEMASTGKSFMPEGLEKDLTPENLADIFAFLAGDPPTAP